MRAIICGDAIDDAVLCFKKGVDAIVDAVFKTGLFFIGDAAYSDYVNVIHTRRSPNKTYANYEYRFSAAFTKLNINGEFVSVSVTLAAWSLIYNSNIDPCQNLGGMSPAVSSIDQSNLKQTSGRDAFLSEIK